LKITFLYVGTSLPGPLKLAEHEINREYNLGLSIALYNCGADLSQEELARIDSDILESALVFVIHVTNQENATSIITSLEKYRDLHRAVIAINCMPDLMRRTHMGKLDFARLMKSRPKSNDADGVGAQTLVRKIGSWMADSVRGRRDGKSSEAGSAKSSGPPNYTKLIGRLPAILKVLPAVGTLADVKHYLYLFCYFLQPTPANIRAMVLYAVKHYVPGNKRIKVSAPESMPAVGIYHPDAPAIFESFAVYRKWYEAARGIKLDPERTIGLLLMRPQIISNTRRHYDRLIHAIESEGLAVIPAISTFMDNRDACRQFFVEAGAAKAANRHSQNTTHSPAQPRARVSQVLSLTGFSFVGGPAMNDSRAAVEFLKELNVPLRSMVSLDIQTIESWDASRLGLNPVQAAMQVAIPEIDGATEPFIYGGMPLGGVQPEPLDDRCRRIARRLVRWNRLQTAPRADVHLGVIVFCFPPNKGNIGTAAELDVFPSLFEILTRLKEEGYSLDVPETVEGLRAMVLGGEISESASVGSVRYRMPVDEYRELCPYVDEIERDWGRAPGQINSNGRELLVQGVALGNVFVGIQPTFGYEGDPMRLLSAESGAPHHGFMALYTYLEKVFRADAVIHVGTHGALEFMPGKQSGLSEKCWPDRLIGELPNIYLYSVNNPSEGTIARRRSYAELISYLTPPIENAGLYKELASLKETLLAYRQSTNETERSQLFNAIETQAVSLHL
jgi:magnesium chelatase subunit H